MQKYRVTVLLVVGGLLLFSFPASAQTRTGRILGQVVGADGVALSGVTVTASSDVVMGGSRAAVSGDTGAYRFAALPPGVYSVTASLEGHQTQTREDIVVSIGNTASVDFLLLPEFAEELVVIDEAPLIDTTSSSVATNYSDAFMKDLPTQRHFYNLMEVAPSVSNSSYLGSDRLIASGSNMQSNNWFLDGIETTSPDTGSVWLYPNPDTIQEIQVVDIGAPAEYGNMLGAAFNTVTKSGSNTFKGGVNAYYIGDNLVDSNIDFDSEYPEYHQEFKDITATLGGPFVKDRLWFFAAYEYRRDTESQPGSDFATTPEHYADHYDLKLSWRINDRNLVDVKGMYTEWGWPDPATIYVAPSARAGQIGNDTAWAINYQSIFSDRTFMEIRYNGWKAVDENKSQTGSTEAAYLDYSPPGGGPTIYWGGVYWPWEYDTSVDQVSASVTHFADDWLAGDHDFKFGIQAGRGDVTTRLFNSATCNYYYHFTYDYYGYDYEFYVRVYGLPWDQGNEKEQVSAFIDDSWRISSRLTLNLGLRYDYHRGIIPSYNRLGVDGQPTGEAIPGFDPLFTWNHISPRLGFAYALGDNQKTVIRGSFGVYNDGNVGGEWNSPPPDPPGLYAYLGESWDGPWDDEPWWVWTPGDFVPVDPNLQAPRTLQYSIGFEHAFADHYAFGVTGVYKDTTDLIGWEIMDDGVYEEVEFTDPFTGNQYTLLNPVEYPTFRRGNRPGFTIDPEADRYWQEYWALMFTFERRFADFWSMKASYTYSKSTGLIPAFLDQYQGEPAYGSGAGSDPNSYLNANGQRLQGDRPHMLRVQANFLLPWQLQLNTMINLQSGQPYSRQIELPTATRPLAIMEPASNDQRRGFQYLWDLGVGKRFDLGRDVALQANLQILNVLNKTPIENWVTLVLAEGEDFVGSRWVSPRRLQLHLGIEF